MQERLGPCAQDHARIPTPDRGTSIRNHQGVDGRPTSRLRTLEKVSAGDEPLTFSPSNLKRMIAILGVQPLGSGR